MGGPFTHEIENPQLEDGFAGNTAPAPSGGGNFWNNASRALPLVTNITNSLQTLPKPQEPYLETLSNPNLVNYSADRLAIERDLQGANKGFSSLNPQVTNALKVGNFAKYLEARGRLTQTERNTNADIINRTNMVNQGVIARNTERKNDFTATLLNRKVNQQRIRNENFTDVVNKVQLARRDRDLMAMENRKLDILDKTYGRDSGWFNRNLYENLNAEQYPNRKKMGGKLSSYLKP